MKFSFDPRPIPAVLALLLLGAGCKPDSHPLVPPPMDTGLPDSTAALVITNLRAAYQEQRLDWYRACFDSTEYAFEFSLLDRLIDPSLPASWPWREERVSAATLFSDSTVERIVLRFNSSPAVPATAADQLPQGHANVWKIAAQSVHLEVFVQHEGEPLEYLIDGDGAEFYLREHRDDGGAGRSHWKLVYWRDKPVGSATPLAIAKMTWGRVKRVYNANYREVYEPNNAPTRVLANLIHAYHSRSISKYTELFDSSVFRFEFSALDRGQTPGMPSTWSYYDDRAATQHMLNNPQVRDLGLRFNETEGVPATEADALPFGPDGVTKVVLESVHLEVPAVDGQGQPVEHLADGDRAEFYFRPYPDERIEGRPRWRIVYWRDVPVGDIRRAGEPESWGRIKYFFR